MSDEIVRAADRAEITVLVDNYTDWLLIDSTEVIQRPAVPPGKTLLAEHGLSLLITVTSGAERHSVMMDAGVSPIPVIHNAESLDADFGSVEAVLLSHGHIDHFGGLLSVLERVKPDTILRVHPEAFRERRINIPMIDVTTVLPVLDETAIRKTGARIDPVRSVSTLAEGMILCLGEVERTTDFEKGFPWAEAKVDGEWVLDPFPDDQGIAIKLKSGGLVVIGGCSHAGIINTVEYAKKVTGTGKIEAVLGGFHLTGPIFEPIIPPTVAEMKRISPRFIVPMHCTGWKATTRFAAEMPEQFILNTTGTRYVFQ